MASQRILIMDDDANLIRLYVKVLRKSGYDVQSVRTLADARAELETSRFDLFVCDMHVEDQNGLTLLSEKWERLQANATEVIVLSGREQFRHACEELGVRHFILKPVSMHMLIRRIDQIFNQSSSNRASCP